VRFPDGRFLSRLFRLRLAAGRRSFAIYLFRFTPVVLIGVLPGCRRGPDMDVTVAALPAEARVQVEVKLSGVPRGGLALRGYAAKEILEVSALKAFGPSGESLEVTASFDTASLAGRVIDLPRFDLPGPLPSSLTVRYGITPGRREGDSHTGFAGRCHGYLGKDFALLSGRGVFLLPQPAEALSEIAVRFALPAGWKAVTPWPRSGDTWHPGLNGKLAAEHLISASIGLGPFHERSFAAGRTRHRLAFASGIASAEEARTLGLLEKVARYLRELLGRDLGPEYMTVVVPRASTGDEIVGEGWASGQGGTLVPLTSKRLAQFAERVIEAHLRHAPYRAEIRRPEEFWLVDAVTHLYAWRAVANAGLIREEDITRSLALRYESIRQVPDVEFNLERLYATPGRHRAERETVAPLVLAYLDRELQAATTGKVGLDAVLGEMFAASSARSLWASLPAVRPGFWPEFRARYVRGSEAVPVEALYALRPTRTTPEPVAGPVVRELTLAYTGNTDGYLENCGCKANQSGGVARRATVLERIRQRDPAAIIVDAGSAFRRPEKDQPLDFLARQEQQLYLEAMAAMRYDASAVGVTELTFGAERFREQTEQVSLPYLAANVRAQGQSVAPASTVLERAGVRVAVLGLFEPPRGPEASSLFEEQGLVLEVEDPVETLRQRLPGLRRQADLVIALGRLSPGLIRRLVEACPELDLVVSTESLASSVAVMAEPAAAGHGLEGQDPQGFLGRTLVLYTHLTRYAVSSVRLGLDHAGRIAAARFEDYWLHEDVPDHAHVRDLLNRFYDRVGKLAAAQGSVQPLFADDPRRQAGRYVGAAACATCHQGQYAQWQNTPHAGAFKTLLERHRHFQPRCVSCHVVGYGTPQGYKLGTPSEQLANVQCEVCHGPGREHVTAPAASNIQRVVPEKVCLECHTPEHSDHFVYAEQLPKVRHDSPQASSLPSPPAATLLAAHREGKR
jgi:cytochrome c554/c'-like protein